uniref:HTH CENPB-type domain-containing protein n=1 Tax=Amphiprion percula TaxID=161767 RepID=A0A3P8SAK2_AMPPE
MDPKRTPDSSGGSALKKRKAISMEVKLDIIRRSEKGERPTNIGRLLGLNRTTVSTIIGDKKRILEHVRRSAPMKSTVITKQRSGLILEMERLLVLWLEDQQQRCIPVSLRLTQEKARSLFEKLKREKGEGSEREEFGASKGWFMRFKARANLHNFKVQREAASGDYKARSDFPSALAEIIREGGYCAEQVFNVDETGLFWKRMPARTYIAKEEETASGYKASKERLTLLLGANAAGDFKLKPLLVYLTENPRALKGIWKGQLPIIWRSNKKAWVTLEIFEDWFTNHFVPEVERYCALTGLPFKVLLLLDTAPGHSAHLDDFNPNVRVVYLPPDTTSLLQPMDQGVIASFKAYYLRTTFAMAVRATEKDKDLTLMNFWKSYDILTAVKNISDSWDEVQQTNLNGMWKNVCPQFVNNFNGFEESVEAVTENIVDLSKQLHLEVEADDVKELLASHEEELSAEDLIQLEKQMIEEEEETSTPEPRGFTSKGLADGFALIEEGLAKFEAEDPNIARHTKVARKVMDCLQCYKEIWEDKKRMNEEMSSLRNKRIELLKGMQGTAEEAPQVILKEEKMDPVEAEPHIPSSALLPPVMDSAASSPGRAAECASPPSSSLPFMTVVVKQEPQSPVHVSQELDAADGLTHCAHSTTPELPVAAATTSQSGNNVQLVHHNSIPSVHRCYQYCKSVGTVHTICLL